MIRRMLEPSAGRLATMSLALALLAGCDKPQGTNAGLTNGPPPSATDKAGVRTDLPSGSTPKADTTNADPGPTPDMPRTASAADKDTVRANPPVKGADSPNSAAGATKPAGGRIETGTPRSPQ